MLKLDKVIEPHLGEIILTSGTEIDDADYALILIHGRGGSAESMINLASEFSLNKTFIAAPQADNFTWYPYRFIEKRELNEPGISSGLTLINSLITFINKSGISKENIFLLGFSQGACLTIDYLARHNDKFGGAFILSGGLIGDNLNHGEYMGDLQDTPVFFGCSNIDAHIPEERVHESAEVSKKLNADVTKRIYENMGHTVNQDEIDFVNAVINDHYKRKEVEDGKLHS